MTYPGSVLTSEGQTPLDVVESPMAKQEKEMLTNTNN